MVFLKTAFLVLQKKKKKKSGFWIVAATRVGFWPWILPRKMWQEVASEFQCWKNSPSNNSGVINVKMGGSVLDEKSFCKMLGLPFSSKLDWAFTLSQLEKLPVRKSDPWLVLGGYNFVTRVTYDNTPENPANWVWRVVLLVVLRALRVDFLVTRFYLAFALA